MNIHSMIYQYGQIFVQIHAIVCKCKSYVELNSYIKSDNHKVCETRLLYRTLFTKDWCLFPVESVLVYFSKKLQKCIHSCWWCFHHLHKIISFPANLSPGGRSTVEWRGVICHQGGLGCLRVIQTDTHQNKASLRSCVLE